MKAINEFVRAHHMLLVLSDRAAQKGLRVCITSHLLGHSVETEPLHYLGLYGCPPSDALPSALWRKKEDSLVECAVQSVAVEAPSQPVELTYCIHIQYGNYRHERHLCLFTQSDIHEMYSFAPPHPSPCPFPVLFLIVLTLWENLH